jgi:hypothetical protein
MTHHTETLDPRGIRTAGLLVCGIVAGPLFVLVWLAQATTRDGFNPARHPLSLLSLGGLGWIQIANFLLAGVLFLACAVGLRKALPDGRASRWGPLLVGVLGFGLILAGVFVTDPGAGFPPGAPAGAPGQISWHGALHETGFALASLSWLGVCVVFGRRFAAARQRRWVAASITTPILVIVLIVWPDLNNLSPRLVGATAIEFAFVAAVAAHALYHNNQNENANRLREESWKP